MTDKETVFIHRLYLESVYKLLFFICVMSRKRFRDTLNLLKRLDSGLRTAGMTDRETDFIHRLYLVSVYKLLFFICVMSRKHSGHPELIEKNRFRLKDCRNDR